MYLAIDETMAVKQIERIYFLNVSICSGRIII